MKQGSLVKLPESKFWWSNKVGIVTETRLGLFFNKVDWVKHQECKVELEANYVWFKTNGLEVISQ